MVELKANRLTPVIGAELTGLDFSTPLNQADYDAVYAALIEHQVIFFRDQHLSPEAHLGFAKRFGEPEPPHPVYPHVAGQTQVVLLENGPDNPPDTDAWHTDLTFRADPPFASILYSRVIPPVGGDTLWSSMTAAYEALPDGVKADIADLRAVHDMSDFRNNFTVGEPDGAATRLNDQLMNSMIGRRPIIAEPIPRPAKPVSEMGVSITRRGPNSSSMPRLTL